MTDSIHIYHLCADAAIKYGLPIPLVIRHTVKHINVSLVVNGKFLGKTTLPMDIGKAWISHWISQRVQQTYRNKMLLRHIAIEVESDKGIIITRPNTVRGVEIVLVLNKRV